MTLRRRLAMGLSAALAAGAFTLTTPTPSSAEPVPAPLPAAAGDADGLAPGLTLTDLASRGEGDWLRYRIPSLTTAPNGDLLAFFDGRPSMNDLPSNITMLMRRSTDGGATWGPQQIVRQDPAPNGYGDPSVVVDREEGKVFLFYAASINQGFAGGSTGSDPSDPNVLHADYSVSNDNGATWTHHRITDQIKAGKANWAGMFAASGEGIQLRQGPHKGRLIQQYTVRISGGNYAVSVYSDDHGATWKASAPVGPGADENKTVELADGDVLLNSRAAPRRLTARSSDGGATYTPFAADQNLPDPANNGSIIRAFPDAAPSDPRAQILLFSNTDHANVRRNLTVRMSCDSGTTWPVSRVVQTGASAYSTLTPLADASGELGAGGYGLFYEREGYRHISFTKFDLDWLGGVCAKVEPSAPSVVMAGVALNVAVKVTNQSGAALPSGRLGLAEASPWATSGADVPALAAGASATVNLSVTAPADADTRGHLLDIAYTAGGTAHGRTNVPVIGGTAAWEWTTGKAFTLEDQPLDVTADLSSVRSLTEGVIHADVTPQVGGTVATIFSASVTTAPDKDVILSLLNGKPYFEVRVGGAGQLVRIESPTALTVGQRYQLAAVVDASGAKLYVDGRLVGQATSKGLFGTVTGLDSMTIGGNRQSRPDTWMFNGTIHSVGVRGPVTPKPSLEVRPVLDAIYSAGDDGLLGDGIQPWVEVYNTGNVALTNVKLTAGQGTGNCTATTLAPGANVVCKNNAIPRHTVTTADMLAGEWKETYTASATVGGSTVQASAELFPVDLREVSIDDEALVWVPTGSFDSSSLVRVPQAGGTGPAVTGDLDLLIPANSRASAQLAVTAGTDLTGLKATVGALSGPGGALTDAVQVRYGRYIKDENTGGMVADPLEVRDSVDVKAGLNQPVWLTVRVPAGTAPGTYSGEVAVSTASGQIGEWPVRVEVPDVEYRDVTERPFVLDLWQHPDAVADQLGLTHWSEEHFQALKPYWADLAEAGQDVLNLAITEDPWLVNHNGTIRPQTWSNYRSTVEWRFDGTNFSFDFDVFDRLVTDARAEGIGERIHAFAMLQFQSQDRFYYIDTRTGEGKWETYTVGDARYRQVWGAFLDAFETHLKEKGWWEDTSLAFDEQTLARMNAMFAVIDEANPEWNDKVALAANSLAEADIANYISFNLTFLGRVSQELIDSRRAEGKPTLFYTWNEPSSPNTVVKTPPFNVRALPWTVEQRDLDGYLRWTYQSWPEDIEADPTFRYGQGDEYIVYPGADGPVSSTRWELFKDGLEDAELLDLAKADLGEDQAVVAAALSGVVAGAQANDAARRGMLGHRAAVIDALANSDLVAKGPITADRLSVADPDAPITVTVPVSNRGDVARHVSLSAEGELFSGDPVTVSIEPGTTSTVRLTLAAGGVSGLDTVAVTLKVDDATIAGRSFDLLAGGHFLSDLEWVSQTNGWGPVERDRANGEDAAGDGGTILLSGRTYDKGIGAHAGSKIVLDLPEACTSLEFDYGIDDRMRTGAASVIAKVLGDGEQLWTSGLVVGSTGTKSAKVDVAGVGRLTLELDPNGGNGQDHFDWANIHVTCAKPVEPSDPPSIGALADVSIELGDSIEVTPVVTAGAAPLSFSATGLPEGVSIDPVTGVISGTPTKAGESAVTVRVVDVDERFAETSFTVKVAPKVTPTPTPTPSPTPTVTPTPTPSPTPMPTATPSPTPTATPSPTKSPTGKPTPTAKPSPGKPSPTPSKPGWTPSAPYSVPGVHQLNGRTWNTSCEQYSQTTRCRTDIWASVVVKTADGFEVRQGWAFNNLTYLPYMTRSQWKGNPLGQTGRWTAADGRQWMTECDTAATGRGACRSYTWTTVYSAKARAGGGYTFSQSQRWVFNNLVLFR